MKKLFKLTLAALMLILSTNAIAQYDYTDNFPPSQNPPGDLSPSDCPQFVTIGWDDNARSGDADASGDAMRWIVNFMKDKTNGDGTPARFAFYSNSTYFSNGAVDGPNLVKRIHNEAYLDGHEIGNHTHSHPHGSAYSVGQWDTEISTCSDWLAKPVPSASAQPWEANTSEGAGVPTNQITGFRTPFLEYNNELFSALKNQGIVYDCSIEEGYEYDQDGTNFFWPYTLDNGSPGHDILYSWGTKPFAINSHPGLWEVPNYVYIAPPDDKCAQYGIPSGLRAKLKSKQSWFDEASGKITGFDYNLWYQFDMTAAEVLATLKYTFDLRYENNRAPMMLGAHTQYYHSTWASNFKSASLAEAKQCMEDFINYVLSKPNAKIVTPIQIIEWMREQSGNNRKPIAVISASPASGNAPLSVQFSGEGSYDPDGDPITYSWNFGDGSSATGQTATHVYTTAGSYQASLTVTDNNGNSKTVITGISALGDDPVNANRPFPQEKTWSGCIKPNVSQSELNSDITSFYETWKTNFLKPTNMVGGYYVHGDCTGCQVESKGTSEGHGYGMIITALMAGYDNNAKTYYDGLYKYFDTHRSTTNNELMCWNVAVDERDPWTGSATDGDFDIAYSLLLAHDQWGSNGAINYLQEAKDMITYGLKVSDMSTSSNRVMMGDWDTEPYSTRSSDWMTAHMQAFYKATNDAFWLDAINEVYSVMGSIISNYSATTGLMPDFVVNANPQPAPENFLEAPTDDDYSWNACRFPWRIAMDYAHFGNSSSKSNLTAFVNWAKSVSNNDPSTFKAGYTLSGTPLVDYTSNAFTSPLMVASIIDPAHQAFLNTGWQQIKNSYYGYYDATINLLCMLAISGNWWVPGDDVIVNNPPVANITANPLSGDAPLTVSFNGSNSYDPDSDPITYAWNFGNGNTASGSTASYTFTNAGTYTVQLTVTDDKNASGSATVSIVVNGTNEQTAYPSGVPHAIPGTLQAEDYDLGGTLAYYDIDATNNGGEYRSDAVDIEPCTDAGGGYNVGWIESGEWLEYTVNVNPAGLYDITISVAADNTGGGSLHIESNGSDKTGLVTIPSTNGWQDWTTVTTSAQLPAGEQVLKVYFDQGGYNVNNLVFVENGNTNIPPTAVISANPTSGIAPLTVNFDASSSTDDGSIVSYAWSFSDGTSATGITASKVFTNAGSYTATLTVTDNEGATGTASISITASGEPTSDLVVEYKEGGYGSATDSQMKPNFQIVNNGSSAVYLSELTIKYWFTAEGTSPVNYNCDWAVMGCSNTNGNFGSALGHEYLELSFNSGSIAAGSNTGTIQTRLAKSDWSNFDENNDYSYDGSITSYTAYDKVTLYQNGSLVWGIEPPMKKGVLNTNTMENSIKFYPNPTRGTLNITSTQGLNGNNIKVRDISGKVVYTKQISEDVNNVTIDLQGNKAGIYLLQIENSNSINAHRFIIE